MIPSPAPTNGHHFQRQVMASAAPALKIVFLEAGNATRNHFLATFAG
jgi:hypothetical protein